MAFPWLLLGIFLCIARIGINAQGPPKVTGSYRATGEMVETLEDDSGILVQIAFEESFDADTKNAAFNIWIMGKNATYVENFETKQTFRYVDGKDCDEMTVKEWIETKSPPSLLSYEDTNNTVRFSLKQLFALDDKYLKDKNVPDEFRGIPARRWTYEIIGEEGDGDSAGQRRVININAYWSDGTWNTTSSDDQVPLGYVVSKHSYKAGSADEKLHEQFINVFGFVPDAIDHKLFEPVQGVICPNRKQTLKFPDVSKWQTVAYHSEVVFPDFKQISYVDVWFDPNNKIMRQDIERVKDQPISYKKSLKYQMEVVLGKFGVIYQITYYKGTITCRDIGIPDYDLDMQNLINFKSNLRDWNIGNLFGLNKTAYTYVGKTSKRDIPCYLFQGLRTDWPEPSANVTSLWEWCFSTNVTTKDDGVIFRNGEYGLVSAQIYILESGSSGDYPPKFRIFHHFYDVNLMDPKVMGATAFDGIDSCFDEDNKRRLQFVIDWQINDYNIYIIENATSNINFLQLWRSMLYRYSGIEPSSLRITKVKAIIAGKELILKFTILDVIHPRDLRLKQVTAMEAEKKLRENIKNNLFSLYYRPTKDSKVLKLGVVPQSMKLQLDDNFIPHVLTTTTRTTLGTSTRKFPFSLETEPDENTVSTASEPVTGSTESVTGSTESVTGTNTKSSTPQPTKKIGEEKKILHKAGTVAGVSIAMVIVGITVGASGYFIKTNGLPPCLKCSGQ